MFERFTQQARDVVVTTQDVTRRLDHPAIDTSHVLLALLADLGIGSPGLRRAVEEGRRRSA